MEQSGVTNTERGNSPIEYVRVDLGGHDSPSKHGTEYEDGPFKLDISKLKLQD